MTEHAPKKSDVHILLVDDHPENLFALEALLEHLGYTLVRAQSGHEALKCLLQEREFAAVLLDVSMPSLDGFETAELIRQRERFRNLPIIFVTAHLKDDANLSRGYSLGAIDYIFKPIVPEILRSKVSVLGELFLRTQEVRRQAEALQAIQQREHERALARTLEQAEAEKSQLRQEYQRREREKEQERLRLFALSVDAICICDFKGPIHQANPACGRLLGLEGRDLLNRTFVELIHPVDRATAREELEKLRHGADQVLFEARSTARDGTIKWISWSATAFPEGGLYCAVGRDVTARRRAEEELSAVKDLLAAQLADMTRLHDMSRRLTRTIELQPMLEEVLAAATSQQRTTMGVIVLQDPDSPQLRLVASRGLSEEILQVLESPSTGPSLWSRCIAERRSIAIQDLQPPELAQHFQAAFSTPLLTLENDIVGALCTFFRDRYVALEREVHIVELYAHQAAQLIEQARLYRKAQEAVSAREQFLSVASHELKTPLTAMQLQLNVMASLLQKSRAKGMAAKLLPTIDLARQEGRRLGRMIDNLLDVSRIRAGKLKLYLEDVDLPALIDGVVRRFASELAAKRTTLAVRVDEPISGRWDGMRIEQVVTNLISNAIRYGNGKPIDVIARKDGGMAVVTVQDRGTGIPKEFLAKICTPFERNAPPGCEMGLGLGLYIVQQIVQAHGGCLRVTSEPGRGSTFTVEVPLRMTVRKPKPSLT